MDVAFYDSDFKEYVVEGVVLSDKNEINNITLNIGKPVKAYLINYGDHTYAKVRFDPNSLANFYSNMNKIENPVSRSMIWYQLYYHI